MTHACHIFEKIKKILNIVENVIFFCYNKTMKKFQTFLILSILLINILCISNISVFYAFDLTAINYVEVNIENINEYNHIDKKSNNILLTSTHNSTISIVSNGVTTSFSEIGGTEGAINNPKWAKMIDADKFIVYDEFERVQLFDTLFEYKKMFYAIESNQSFEKLGLVVDCAVDYSGTAFMLDKDNNKLLKLDVSETYIQDIPLNIQNFIVTENSRIAVNPNGNLVAIYGCSENLIIINLDTSSTYQIEANNVDKIFFDCNNNLFLVNKTNLSIQKYGYEDYTFSSEKTLPQSFVDISIDIETGNIYYLNDNICYLETSDFTANANTSTPPIDITCTTLNENAVMVCKINKSTKLFATCVSFSSSINLENNTKVLVLDYKTAQNNNLSYVLVNFDGTEQFGYVHNDALEQINSIESAVAYKTICKNVDVYTFPTVSAGKNKILSDEAQSVIVVGNSGEFVDYLGNCYYEVLMEEKIGYINQKYLVEESLFESEPIETEKTDNNQGKFVAFMLAIASLIIATAFVCVVVVKKKEN